MFETEADEYAKKVYGNSTEMDHYGIADAFNDGAEFGYNKGLKAKINTTTVSDYPAMEYAKTIIEDLLNNSDEYARQRAVDFLKEE